MNPPSQTRAFAIYVLGPCPNGKFYVGQAQKLTNRLRAHELAQGGCPELHEAVKLFGWGAFPIQIVEETDVAEEADRLECLYITKFNALIPHGYNMTTGGRGQRFEPGAKVVGFTEHPVAPEEIREMARSLVAEPSPTEQISVEDEMAWLVGCPCCGEWNDGDFCNCSCSVAPDFTRFILRHIAQGAMLPDLPLIDDPKLIKKWRRSRGADFFIQCEKRGVKEQTIASVGAYAAQKYATRFWPYLEASLRRRCLLRKKLPSYSLGRFDPTHGGKMLEGKRINIERLLRRNRKEMGSGEGNIEVFAKILEYEKEWSGKFYNVVVDVFAQHGGSPEEIEEAKRRTVFYRRFARELSGCPGTLLGLSLVHMGPEKSEITEIKFSSRPHLETMLTQIMDLPATERATAMVSLRTNPPEGVTSRTKRLPEDSPNPPPQTDAVNSDS